METYKLSEDKKEIIKTLTEEPKISKMTQEQLEKEIALYEEAVITVTANLTYHQTILAEKKKTLADLKKAGLLSSIVVEREEL